MAGLNKVILIGRIGKDPDTFTFDDGTKKISFSLATSESYKDRNSGDWIEQTEWHNIVGYRFLADKNFAKGDLVYVEGKLKTRKYKDKDGNDRYTTEVVAEKINILTRSGQGGYAPAAPGPEGGNNEENTPSEPLDTGKTGADMPADDLPF